MYTKSFFAIVWIVCSMVATAQLTPFYQYTLLPQNQMDEIIGETSGETALHHAIEMVGYQRNRPFEEYGKSTFRESEYVLNRLKEYGLPGAQIERFDGGQAWDGIKGELWEVSPNRRKLADYDDIALSLAQGSRPADVTAELVWVEEGTEKDFEGMDVTGKIVVTSSTAGRVHSLAVSKGAAGVVAFGSSRELQVPLAIPAGGLYGNDATFAFYLTPREGYKLRDRLISGEKITVHAVVESEMVNYEMQIPTCFIPGTDPNAGEIILSAHIFEGFTKQGANDNVSGSAVILEVARTLKQLIDEKRLERPKRDIRFIWVPEYSGTIPWVKAHRDIMEQTLCNINLDMVGIHLKSNNSFFSLMRTTFGNPHYINDVMENFFVYMGEVNREILANRSAEKIANQIVAPSGSDDPFYYQIEQHYGSSDHEVFNHWSTHVPGVMLITWPDLYYHTSEDLPGKLDPTQLKRATVIAAAGAYTVAAADEKMAANIAGTVFTHASKRFGIEMGRAMNELENSDKNNFDAACKKTRAFLETTFVNEKATLESVSELAPESVFLRDELTRLTASLEQIYLANVRVLDAKMEATANQLGKKVPDFKLNKLEKQATGLIPLATSAVAEGGFGVERSIRDLPKEMLEKYPIRDIANTTELCALINGKNSALDIKKMLDTQYRGESDLKHILNYLELLKIKGLIAYTE